MGMRWYVAYPISYRQLEEMMQERGVEVDHSTLSRWVVKYVPRLDEQFRERNRLLVMIVSSDLARTAGVNVRRLDLVYLLMFAITIGIGLRYLGVLLMGALIIIPAVTAKGIARNIGQMLSMTVAT